MKVYISGPMTGVENYNHAAFKKACALVKKAGHEPVSPHKAPQLESWEESLRHDLQLLLGCDAIALLPGWERSQGACLVRLVAMELSMPIMHIEDDSIDGIGKFRKAMIFYSCYLIGGNMQLEITPEGFDRLNQCVDSLQLLAINGLSHHTTPEQCLKDIRSKIYELKQCIKEVISINKEIIDSNGPDAA